MPISNSPLLPSLLVTLSMGVVVIAQEEREPLPDDYFQVQDELGYFWDPTENGALTSGETQYLQSGLNLLVGGDVFQPSDYEVQAPTAGEARLELTEKRSGLTISRDLWFDKVRSGVRVIDTITNSGEVPQTVEVSLRTTYPFAWQSLHNLEGDFLSKEPVLALAEGDRGVLVEFNPVDGRQDTLLLSGSGNGSARPVLKAAGNSRELTLSYDLRLPPRGSRSLYHWIFQRNLSAPSAALVEVSRVIQNGRLIRPGIDSLPADSFANFDAEAFPNEDSTPPQLRAMIALNEFLDAVGVHRRSEDILWLSQTNQISGRLEVDGDLTILANHVGEKKISLARVAAIRGAGSAGGEMKLFLRDGRVLVGSISGSSLQFFPGGIGEGIPIDPATLGAVLLANEVKDGVAVEGASHYLECSDGSVFAVTAPADTSFQLLTEWGSETLSTAEISEIAAVSTPVPHHRIIMADKSHLSGFLEGTEMQVALVGDAGIALATNQLSRLWTTGRSKLSLERQSIAWTDFAEVPTGQSLSTGFLLADNQILAGTFSEETLEFLADGITIEVATNEIRSLKRNPSIDDPGAPFTVKLQNGDSVEGSLPANMISIRRNGRNLVIPNDMFIEFQQEIAE